MAESEQDGALPLHHRMNPAPLDPKIEAELNEFSSQDGALIEAMFAALYPEDGVWYLDVMRERQRVHERLSAALAVARPVIAAETRDAIKAAIYAETGDALGHRLHSAFGLDHADGIDAGLERAIHIAGSLPLTEAPELWDDPDFRREASQA